MSRLFKIFLIIALSVFSDTNLSAADTLSSCGFDAVFEQGEIKTWEEVQKWDATAWDCVMGAISNLAAEGGSRLIAGGAGALMRAIKNNPDKFWKILKNAGLSDEAIEKIFKKLGVGSQLDEVLNAVLEEAKHFDDNVLDIAEVGLKNWKTFQNRVSTQLKALYPNSKIGSQITLDITYIENGIRKNKTIIPDDLVQIEANGLKKYKVIDAKTSTKDLVNKPDLTSTCTVNQKKVYPLVDGGGSNNGVTITKVEMRGQRAKDAFGNNLFNVNTGKAQIQLETGVEFWVNNSTTDFTQYLVRPRIK